MNMIEYFVSRTDQKLRFARVHLDELRTHPSRNTGDDFERAHHEAFLSQLYGASDAFLQELNVYYKCGLAEDKVRREALEKSFKARGLNSSELDKLTEIESAAGSYLSIARDLRHHVTHRGGIPMQHYFNGPSYIVHPKTREEYKTDCVELFDNWLGQLSNMLSEFRTNARRGNT